MQQDEHETKVVFRKFKDEPREAIAIFPQIPGTYEWWTCSSYMHVGQHGSCDAHGIVSITTLATEEEYADLKYELEHHVGYKLKVAKRITYEDQEMRKQEIMRVSNV